ncbi:MAG: hypothetical protein M3Y34_01260 [Actinomycetota bacterium]|nr:hypothetical protein [Actinomycetota bacterium]
MGKRVLAVVVALVAAQVFSGCYFLRELSWSVDKAKPGEKTVATVGLQPTGGPSMRLLRGPGSGDSYFFLGAAGELTEGIEFKRPIFDSKDVTGQKEKLIADPELYDLAFEDGPCGSLITAPIRRGGGFPVPGVAYRTEGTVSSDTRKFVEAKQKVKVDNGAPGGGFFGLMFSGEWIDDGDGIPEDPETTDDEISCTGFSTTTFQVKGEFAP